MNSLLSGITKLNPFTGKDAKDDDDVGEVTNSKSLAGGGHAGRDTTTIDKLRISDANKAWLIEQNVLSERDAGIGNSQNSSALADFLHKPHAIVPADLTDRSHPLPDYFVSSSHNTYLLAHQLYGNSSAEAYEEHLIAGARCVEIDAWDGDDKDEPKVTHGWTLTSNISFRAVCETIRDVVDQEAASAKDEQGYRTAPILISLENHCDAHGQQRMVDIMREVWGHRLLSKAVRDKGTEEQEGTGQHVTLAELGSKIAVIVEYHFPGEPDSDDDSSSSSEDEDTKKDRRQYKKQKETAPATIIIPSLAGIGVYAQSVKPPNNAWFEKGVLENSPHHPLINVSETGLLSHLPQHSSLIAQHNADHLMRVYPKGTRISSKNLNPVPFWAVGAQVCALNWQTFGASMQLNEALFSGTDGYVLKPASLRHGHVDGGKGGRKKRLLLHVKGATDVPIPADRPQDGSDIKPYLTCTLVDPSHAALLSDPPKRKTSVYKHHRLNMGGATSNPPNVDPFWSETLEWEYEDDDLAFLRMLIKSDDSFASNPKLAVAAVRLLYVQRDQWVLVRMLNLKGQETTCSLLVMFEIRDQADA